MPDEPKGDSRQTEHQLSLLDRAMQLPPRDREEFVRREAGDDEALRTAVLRLLEDAFDPEKTRIMPDIRAKNRRPRD